MPSVKTAAGIQRAGARRGKKVDVPKISYKGMRQPNRKSKHILCVCVCGGTR